MRKYLLPHEGEFYKANLHCHSTLSDGRFTAEKIKEIYKEKGYHVIAFSDHNRLISHMDLQDDNFLPLTSIEIDISDIGHPGPAMPTYHLNFFSKDAYKEKFVDTNRVYDVGVINDLIKRANEDGFLAQYNHPRWSFQEMRDFLPLEGLFAFEIYNHGCEVEMLNGYAEYEYEIYCKHSKNVCCTATDDNHDAHMDLNSPYNDSFGGFTMIKAPSLKYDDIINAMEKRDLYASTGPYIYDLYIEDGYLHIETSPCNCIALLTDSRHCHLERANDDTITKCSFKLDLPYEYIRIECVDKNRNKAMTRAYFRNETEC